ncbi:MAG: T9SS type A sorting domain-containing protein [candidate division KSB1 bacterium]|nr:T9SS type A sorting domain-containing protein [candidate division KSB1 bacterium]MDZ7366231.1 T9SS type A sorting domain-containing protein [candidate division KSB1 bacterium]MDZ7404449.1 T9SS type A sorting domain-containing protein [candidate division KSB1 bacterium]
MRKIIRSVLFLAVVPAAAGDLKVTWQQNTEPDLAGYFVYFGKKERPQANRIDVGRQTQYRIQNLPAGETYYISVTAVDKSGNESVASEFIAVRVLTDQEKNGGLPPQHFLLQSHPNPFHLSPSRTTTISFALSEPSRVKLEIFNLLGQRMITLVDRNLPSGEQKFSWNGRDHRGTAVPTGVYLYRLETDRQTSTRKLVVCH